MRPCRSTAAPLTSCDFQSKPQAGPAWEALETLLRTQAQWTENDAGRVDLALARLGALGLDLERLTADMASPGLDRILEQDVRDARTLQVTKTPEYFINGRPLPRFGFDQLVALVKEELQSASSAK
jgi:protein-disulfide isomerase